jgi:hypothetical protein
MTYFLNRQTDRDRETERERDRERQRERETNNNCKTYFKCCHYFAPSFGSLLKNEYLNIVSTNIEYVQNKNLLFYGKS